MIKQIKNRLFKGVDRKRLVTEVCDKLANLRSASNIVALYGSPTGPHWLGIANATKGLFQEAAIEIPQSYSNPVFSEEEINVVCEKIKELKFEKVIVSGFALYFFSFIDKLHTSCRIQTLFHGTISEFHNPVIQEQIKLLIQYAKQGKVQELSFVKKGLDKVFSQLYGLRAFHQPLNTPDIPLNIDLIEVDSSKINIGVFGADTFNKNLHNQVIYVLMHSNTVVHVLNKDIFDYLGMGDRIIGYGGNLSKERFLGILGAMDLNMYMSYSESWGLVAYESEAMGVPCLRMDDIDYFEKIKAAIASRKSG